MSLDIKLKRSATQNAEPSVDAMELGEIAINTYDGRVFIKTYDGEFDIKRIISEEELINKLANGDYNISVDLSSINWGPGLTYDSDNNTISVNVDELRGLSIDSTTNKIYVKLSNDFEFNSDGEISEITAGSDLCSNWKTNLSHLTQYTYDINYDGSDYYINDGGDDIYDKGNYIKVNDVDLSYTQASYQTAGFLFFELIDVLSIKFSGNTGADGWGNILHEENLVLDTSTTNTKTIYTSYKVIEQGKGGDPAIHHIVFSVDETVASHTVPSSTDNDQDEYYFNNNTKAYLMVMWSKSTNAWDDGNLPLQSIYDALFKNCD